MKEMGPGPLQNGGKVVIIGGGPAGTATAIAIQKTAAGLGRRIQVVIVEEKQFAGEQQHNQCAGVLSQSVAEIIERDLGVKFPKHLSRGLITGYVLHSSKRQIVLDGDTEPSIALRRVQFDNYMLDSARQFGITVLPARVTDLEFHADRVVIYTNSISLEADLVVGAFGMDEGTATIFRRAVGYQPPTPMSSVVTKYHPGEQGMQKFGQRIHAFLPANPRIEFGGITPKGNHLTINIAGTKVDTDLMKAFMGMESVRSVLPCLENAGHDNPNDLRYFKGRFPCGLARNFLGNRYVMVGDAAGLVRAFKGKGVTSGILTGIRAAEVIMRQGISASAFLEFYRAANHDIISDLPYGQVMRQFTILAARSGFMNTILCASEHDAHLQQALFNAVSAHKPYREVMRAAISLSSIKKVLWALAAGEIAQR